MTDPPPQHTPNTFLRSEPPSDRPGGRSARFGEGALVATIGFVVIGVAFLCVVYPPAITVAILSPLTLATIASEAKKRRRHPRSLALRAIGLTVLIGCMGAGLLLASVSLRGGWRLAAAFVGGITLGLSPAVLLGAAIAAIVLKTHHQDDPTRPLIDRLVDDRETRHHE